MKRWLLGTVVLFCCCVQARADLGFGRRPVRPFVPAESKLEVQIDPNARTAQLIIPANLVQGNKAGAAPGKGLGAGDGFNTVVIGLALAGACVTSGWWLSRRGKGKGPIAAGVMLLCLGIGGSVLFADISAPPRVNKVETVKLPADVRLPEKLSVVIGPVGDTVRLVLPGVVAAPPGAGPKSAPPRSERPDAPKE